MRIFSSLSYCIRQREGISFFFRKEFAFFGEYLLNRKGCFPQQGKDVPQRETQAGKGFWGILSEKTDSTFSTNIKSDVTQLEIV
jgi:hypothetical protein